LAGFEQSVNQLQKEIDDIVVATQANQAAQKKGEE
jgi:hypothetical protein